MKDYRINGISFFNPWDGSTEVLIKEGSVRIDKAGINTYYGKLGVVQTITSAVPKTNWDNLELFNRSNGVELVDNNKMFNFSVEIFGENNLTERIRDMLDGRIVYYYPDNTEVWNIKAMISITELVDSYGISESFTIVVKGLEHIADTPL